MALSNKQRVFVAEYSIDFNATRAAERAGYKGNANVLAVTGYDLLRNPKIAEEIEKQISARCMTKSEVLVRLAEHARGDISDFTEISADGLPSYNFRAAADSGKMRLIKKLKTKRKSYLEGKGDDQHLVTEVDVEIELYDAQAADALIGKHHKLFTDKIEHDLSDRAADSAAGLIAFMQQGANDGNDK
jgi:phage terminase small subunit